MVGAVDHFSGAQGSHSKVLGVKEAEDCRFQDNEFGKGNGGGGG